MKRTAQLIAVIGAVCVAFSLMPMSDYAAAQSNYPAPTPGQTYPDAAAPNSASPYPPAAGAGPTTGDPTGAYTPEAPPSDKYTIDEIVTAGHNFFGQVTEGLAGVVEHAVASYGLPNGYILGQEASGALVGGLRYGDGTLYTKNAGQHPIYWQGPSVGLDMGAEGNRTMMLVYNLPSVDAIHNRFAGVAGSAYLVAGVGMTVLAGRGIYIVPIVAGVGARLGVNIGYLKFTPTATWNPF